MTKRGCTYCIDRKKVMSIKGYRVWGCPYEECPYHELDEYPTYRAYLKANPIGKLFVKR